MCHSSSDVLARPRRPQPQSSIESSAPESAKLFLRLAESCQESSARVLRQSPVAVPAKLSIPTSPPSESLQALLESPPGSSAARVRSHGVVLQDCFWSPARARPPSLYQGRQPSQSRPPSSAVQGKFLSRVRARARPRVAEGPVRRPRSFRPSSCPAVAARLAVSLPAESSAKSPPESSRRPRQGRPPLGSRPPSPPGQRRPPSPGRPGPSPPDAKSPPESSALPAGVIRRPRQSRLPSCFGRVVRRPRQSRPPCSFGVPTRVVHHAPRQRRPPSPPESPAIPARVARQALCSTSRRRQGSRAGR